MRYSVILLLFVYSSLFCQDFGNEWISYEQKYFKTKVAQDGIYRISQQKLVALGASLNDFTPSKLQMYWRGTQIAITVVDNNLNDLLDPSDYIEFYGLKNNGDLDTLLYDEVAMQCNPYLNLYSDSTTYFLTSSIKGPWKRIDQIPFENVGTKIEYHLENYHRDFTNSYYEGMRFFTSEGTYLSNYGYSEGFGSEEGINFEFNIPLNNFFLKTGLNTSIKVGYMPVNQGRTRGVTLKAGASKLLSSLVAQVNTEGEKNGTIKASFPFTNSSSNSLAVNIDFLKVANETSNIKAILNYLDINYPQSLNYSGQRLKRFVVPITASTLKANMEIKNLSNAANLEILDISSYANIKSYQYQFSTTNIICSFTPISDTSIISVLNRDSIFEANLQPVNFRKFITTDSLFVIISHPSLSKPVGNIANPVVEYAKFRNSLVGGQYDTLVANVIDLFDQFSYGLASPLSIRRFCEFLSKDNVLPKYLFIIGKGYDLTSELRFKQVNYVNLIPAFGNPGSDYLFSTGLGGFSKYVQAIPTGRISAKTPEEVVNYLEKIKSHETTSFFLPWRKNVAHLSGGKTQDEGLGFKNFINELTSKAQSNYFGANVSSYSKTTGDVIQVFNLSKELNEGLSLITFFGHSSSNGGDIDIGLVTDPTLGYKNEDKYPIIILNGCKSGNMFTTEESFGENWISASKKGAIGFVGHINFGFVSTLQNYNRILYTRWFNDSLNLNKSIGKVLQIVNKEYTNNSSNLNPYDIGQATQMALQGDPAVKLFPNPKPDFVLSAGSIFVKTFNNEEFTALVDSFQIGIPITNLGISINNKIPIYITRRLPNGTQQLYPIRLFDSPKINDTAYYTITSNDFNGAGSNTFEITLDPDNTLDEYTKTNNKITFPVFIPQSGIKCLFPREFSILDTNVINLVAQSSNLIRSATDYYFEIDTSYEFNSPLLRSNTISATSMPIWENINLMYNLTKGDSTVFYWRVRYSQLSNDADTIYANSSFVYIPNSPEGWSQSEFPQFYKNTNSPQINTNKNGKTFDFKSLTQNIEVVAGPGAQSILKLNGQFIYKNTSPELGAYSSNGILCVAFDQNTLNPYLIQFDRPYNCTGCGNSFIVNRYFFFDLPQDPVFTMFNNYLNDVKFGDYLLLVTYNKADFEKWEQSSKDLFKQLFSPTKFSSLTNKSAYIFLGRKGLSPIFEDFNSDFNTPISFKDDVAASVPFGTITSTLIGPAHGWGSLFRKVEVDNPKTDIWGIDVIGVDNNLQETTLLQNINSDAVSLNSIDSKQYPFLKLKALLKDSANLTPPQLNRWQVVYSTDIPEGSLMLDDNDGKYSKVTQLQEGQSYTVEYLFKNISNKSFKTPFIVEYTLNNSTTGKSKVFYDTLNTILGAQQEIRLTKTFDTKTWQGENTCQINVNPKSQQEQYYENNIWSTNFKVIKDNRNPVLEVTFDGQRIMNGDIVSASPMIVVSINDENKYIYKQDTSGINLLFKKQCTDCSFKQISLSDNNVRYFPASSNNKFRVEYNPQKLEDGIYTLCVQGTDASNNSSGVNPYCIDFRVINATSISHFYPYPNPFSNFTRFVFTVTGENVPDEIKIQIMTVTGKVVREILQSEIGPIKIGTNITQYAWDGKDEFGDKLANGVYLYKVSANISGKSFDHLDVGAEKAFKEGFGKVVILR